MHALGPGAFRQILDDAAGHAAGNAEAVDGLPAIGTESGRDPCRRRHGAEHGGWMEAGFVHGLRNHQAEAADGFDANCEPKQHILSRPSLVLGGGQHRRDDDGAGMHRAALEGVIEILAMRRRAIDEGCRRCRVPARMPDNGCRPGIAPRRARGCNVISVPRDEAQADHIDQQALGEFMHRVGQPCALQPDDAIGQMLGNRDGGKRFVGHFSCSSSGRPACRQPGGWRCRRRRPSVSASIGRARRWRPDHRSP